MKMTRKGALVALVAAASLTGGAIGASLVGTASAQTTTPTTTPATTAAPASNEDATHESGESPQREADENAGRGFGHGHSNTDPAHEAAESPARQAEEAAEDAQATSPTTTTTVK